MKSSLDELMCVFIVAVLLGLGWGIAITLMLTK